MKYCNNCGKEVSDNAVVCPFCGCAVASKNVEVDKPSTGLNILSFLIPLVGLILYLSWQNSTPIKARRRWGSGDYSTFSVGSMQGE